MTLRLKKQLLDTMRHHTMEETTAGKKCHLAQLNAMQHLSLTSKKHSHSPLIKKNAISSSN